MARRRAYARPVIPRAPQKTGRGPHKKTPPGGPATLLEQNNLSGARLSWVQYNVTMPTGKSKLTVTTTGGSGDADLYVRAGVPPTTSSYDCRPYTSGNQETCVLSNTSGTIYIALRGYVAYSGVNLKAVAK
jgi:hypothetical protein